MSKYNLNSEEEITQTINDLKNKINNNKTTNLIANITKYKQSIEQLKLENIYDETITEHNYNLQQLHSQIVNIPDNINNLNIDTLKQKQLELQFYIINVQESLIESNNKLNKCKTNNISKIKLEISNLKNQLQYTDKNSENKLTSLFEKLKDFQSQLFEASIDYFNNQHINEKQINILKNQLKLKKEFANHVNNTIDLIPKYNIDDNIKSIFVLQQQWLDNYNIWKKTTENQINNDVSTLPNVESLTERINKLNKNITNKSFDMFKFYKNNTINTQISKMENLIDILTEIDNLNKNKNILLQELKIIDDNIDNYQYYQKHNLLNKQINNKINNIKTKIIEIQLKKSDIKSQIKNFKLLIEKSNNKLSNIELYKTHLQLLDIFKLQFINHSTLTEKYDKLYDQKNNFTIELNNINNQINDINSNLMAQKNIEKLYIKTKQHQKIIENKKKLYQSYCNIMNYNGIPYEILKSFLPQIKNKLIKHYTIW